MKERAALIGASFDIETRPHRGTTVLVTVPNAIRKKRRALAATSTTEWK
jgi:nitrate/nitrite-specific signal transduction histidine kinase